MAKSIPFERQTHAGDDHQLALVSINNRAHLIERIADSVRILAIRLERRSPAIAADLADYADEIALLAESIKKDANTAMIYGEKFLNYRKEMAQALRELKRGA